MRVLVLGSGAKDHAITWWFSKSCMVSGLYIAPGNLATEDIATNLPDVDPSDPVKVYSACMEYSIDLVFIGTEAPLFTGVVDYLSKRGISVFGAPPSSIRLEGDRAFARSFTERHSIPVPRNSLFADYETLERYLLKHRGEHFTIKSNSVAPSRIMLMSKDTDALLSYASLLFEKGPVLLEEYIPGIACSCTLIVDKNGYLMLPLTSDYAKREHNDNTPTGGMGAVCPIPIAAKIKEKIVKRIIEPTLYGMKVESLSYRGVLTLSMIITKELDPILVDYHVRFNDPAAQAMIPTIRTDLAVILRAVQEDRVSSIKLETSDDCTVAVVLASPGYPIKPEIGKEVEGISPVFLTELSGRPNVFCGAIQRIGGKAVTTGGRNLTVVGKGKNLEEANKKAYALISDKRFDNLWYREDIGNKFFQS